MISRLEYYKFALENVRSDMDDLVAVKRAKAPSDYEREMAILMFKQDDLFLLALHAITLDKMVTMEYREKARELVLNRVDPVLGSTNDVRDAIMDFIDDIFFYNQDMFTRHVIECEKHGPQPVISSERSWGYAGPIYHIKLECGCTEVDASDDVPEM